MSANGYLFNAMATPLHNARHEAFALHIANGHKLERAHELAGFKPDRKTAWSLRHRPDVARRVEAILKHRMQADTKHRARREKKDEDLRYRVIEGLKRIAFADVRDVVNWKQEPVVSPDGEVLDFVDRISVTGSDKLTTDAAAAIRGVFQKSGQVRVEMHDKQAALLALAKHLRLFDDPPSPPSVTVNQLNVGALDAIETARRLAFVIEAARQAAPVKPALIIEGPSLRSHGATPSV